MAPMLKMQGLKAKYTMNRRDPLRGNVPVDTDGAYRVHGRKDGLTEGDLRAALKRSKEDTK